MWVLTALSLGLCQLLQAQQYNIQNQYPANNPQYPSSSPQYNTQYQNPQLGDNQQYNVNTNPQYNNPQYNNPQYPGSRFEANNPQYGLNSQQYGVSNQQYGLNNPQYGSISNERNQPYSINSIDGNYYNEELRCPEYWVQFQQSCYKFIKSPVRPYNEARRICQSFTSDGQYGSQSGGDLVSISSAEEHGFLINQLNWKDPQHRRWYVGAHQQSPNYWNNPDGSPFINIENAMLSELDRYGKDYLAYNFSKEQMHWSFQMVKGDEPLLFICEANILALQKFVVDDRSIEYGVEVDNPEQIPRGPYFIKEPQDVTFDTSIRKNLNDVTLSCLAGGYPTPTYQWFKEDYENDRLVAREINPLKDVRYTLSGGMFIINRPDAKIDRASYHCKATNKYGTIISESVQLTFGYILEFVLKRSPETGDLNWGKVVYCDPPAHFPSLKYYWSRDHFPNFVEEDKRVFTSNDGSLYFSSLETIDRGNYSCSVQSQFSDSGRNGPFFALQARPHPNYQNLKFPNNFPKAFPEAPIQGKDVRLECMAFGYPPPSYNWTRKGSTIPRSAYFLSFNRVLIIPKVQVEDEGEYVCRAFNDRGTIQNSVFLNIQAEPNFTIPLTDKHVDSRGELIWTCEAFGIPDVNYTWWRDGRQLAMGYLDPLDQARIKIQDNILTINPVDDERDPGMYQCRATNTLKTKYSSAQLRVLAFKPSFKKRPLESETYAADQGNVTIRCNPEAAPKPKYVWKKDGIVIGSGGHRKILDNGNLIISPVSRDDEGLYTCVATNELGMDESRGRLIVLRAPRLRDFPQSPIITDVGNSFSLYCNADTEELLDIAYIWNHNGMRIRDIDIINSKDRFTIEGGFLNIINSTFTDAGDYECIVKSAVGKIGARTRVIVQGPPGPPGGLQVIDIQRRTATLQWTDGAAHGRPIVGYSISGRTKWNNTWTIIDNNVRAKEIDRYTGRKEGIVEDLTPGATYEFRVAAWNHLGLGVPSAPSPRHSTPADKPYIAPKNIGGGGGKIGDLTITWTPLSSEDHNGPGIYYRVFWRRRDSEEDWQSLDLEKHGNVGSAVVHIPSKYYYTQFLVRVQAINKEGEGPRSNEVVIYSAEDMPQVAPQLVSALSYNSTALNVSWQAIEQTREKVRGKLIGHRIKYWKKDNKEEDAVYYLSRTTRPWALIVGLIPDTQYFVKVMAYNSAGEGPESERFIERTYRKAPQKPPSSVQVFGMDPSTVRVQWRYVQPSLEEEPLQGYKIRVWEYDHDMSRANDTYAPLGEKLEAYIRNLTPGKTYKMRVLAYSNGGDGRMSSPTLVFQMGHPAAYRSTAPNTFANRLLITVALGTIIAYLIKT